MNMTKSKINRGRVVWAALVTAWSVTLVVLVVIAIALQSSALGMAVFWVFWGPIFVFHDLRYVDHPGDPECDGNEQRSGDMRYVEFGVKYAPDDREPWVENAASEADANGLVRIHEKLDPRLHASVVQRTVDRGEWQ